MKTVVIDPGHGGADPGALSPSGFKESDFALDVCLRIKALLTPYVFCLCTRDDDRFLTLSARPAYATRVGADVFVSYHFNSASKNDIPNSWEIFTTPGQNRSDRLASLIGDCHELLFPEQKKRSDYSDGDLDKEAWHAVTRLTNCPSCLIEGEFINTPHGERLIADPSKRQKMALAAAVGILDFLKIPHDLLDRLA